MISIQECRKILGNTGDILSDKELEEIRNGLYQLCKKVVDDCFNSPLK